MTHIVDLENDLNDTYEEKADNVMELKVYNKGVEITAESFVEIFLSRNGLIGLGTELIRMAYNFKEGKHVHLEPVDNEEQIQRMGVFLTPNSAKLVICCNKEKTIDEYIN